MNRIRDRRWDGKSRWEPCHVLSPLPVSADDEISAEPRKVAGNEITPDRRHSLRQKVNTPAFASFDGVTGGVILDLSEEGLAMHTATPLEPHRHLSLHLSLSEATQLDTTGYVAWADALGRAGVRFSDLPEEARARLKEWLRLNNNSSMMCRASVGKNTPALGSKLDATSGLSGECIRTGKALRCDDAQTDPRVNTESCQWLDIRSILAAPVQYERQVVGLIEIFSNLPFAFDDGDVAVVERLAQTVLLTMSQSAHSKRK